MLDRSFIRENLSLVEGRIRTRGVDFPAEKFLQLDGKERSLRVQWEELRASRNRASQDIAELKKKGRSAQEEIVEVREIGTEIKKIGENLDQAERHLDEFLAGIPNLPHKSVPAGADETSNTVIREVGELPALDFAPRDHVDLGADLKILDPDRAVKITGTRFAVYYGSGALLERALINFMLDLHTREHGYIEVLPPFLANRKSFFATGNLPKFEADLFRVQGTDYFLIPTAEVPVTNLFAGEVLEEEDLPISLVAYTPCFRAEAGSYGKDTRGLIRQHQFNKVELVKFVSPADSFRQLELLTGHAEEVLRRLKLPYRVVLLSGGDMGFSSAKTYDLEVWIPSQKAFREISSCSNFVDFQARRADIRCRSAKAKSKGFVHTLNGSGLAIGRTWVAIVENFQQADGSVLIPEALRPYLHGRDRISQDTRVPF